MKHCPPLTSSSDAQRTMPDDSASRHDRIDSALASLENEQRRLQRLGFEIPLARCHHQIRYWRFLKGVCSMMPESQGDRREVSWPDDR